MDMLTSLILIGGGSLALIGGWLAGKWTDLDWRCAQLRKYLKKNFVVLNILEGDQRSISSRVVNADNEIIQVDNYMWALTKGEIYRKDKRAVGTKIEKGNVFWGNQGAPNIWVTKSSIKPISLDQEKESHVKPDEVGSVINAWNSNEEQKRIGADKNRQTLLMAIAFLTFLAVAFAFIAMDNSGKTLEAVKSGATTAATVLPAGGVLQNNSIVVKPPTNPSQGGSR